MSYKEPENRMRGTFFFGVEIEGRWFFTDYTRYNVGAKDLCHIHVNLIYHLQKSEL